MTTFPIAPLYLSRLLLNPRSRQVMAEIGNPYEMHRTLMHAFPKATDDTKRKVREEFGVLFRAEVDDLPRAVKVYVQSQVKPDWSFLDEMKDYLSTDTEMPECEYKDIMPACRSIRNGQVLTFRLRANPTKRIWKDDDRMKGKRVELRCEDEQMDWLIRKGLEREKGRPGGFEILMNQVEDHSGQTRQVPRVTIRIEEKQKCRKEEKGRFHETTHLAVRFDGLLRITDADALQETLVRGIGPAKAFGFGLLSIAAIHH